ncbi:MAG: cupin domain-containing protein [Alphaproteobacteria bacterium]|nr:cupin domain-containing protein [Alphaproteobacteria bacterium]
MMKHLTTTIGWVVMAGLIVVAGQAGAKDYPPVNPLLKGGKTILGQPLTYPTDGPAQIQSVIVTMPPGAQTGLHTHPYPTFGYILEGELTVSYPAGVTKTYRQGEAVMEAVDTPHNGKNTGTEPVRILVVFMGVEGKANTEVLND